MLQWWTAINLLVTLSPCFSLPQLHSLFHYFYLLFPPSHGNNEEWTINSLFSFIWFSSSHHQLSTSLQLLLWFAIVDFIHHHHLYHLYQHFYLFFLSESQVSHVILKLFFFSSLLSFHLHFIAFLVKLFFLLLLSFRVISCYNDYYTLFLSLPAQWLLFMYNWYFATDFTWHFLVTYSV